MIAKDMLTGYAKAKAKIRRLELKKEEYRTIAESCTVDPTQEKVQTSKSPDPMGSAVIKMVEVDDEIETAKTEAAEYLEMLDQYMSQIADERQWQVLVMRYFKGASWRETAETVGISDRYVLKIHSDALKELQAIMDQDEVS